MIHLHELKALGLDLDAFFEGFDLQLAKLYNEESGDLRVELFCRRQQISRFLLKLNKRLIQLREDYKCFFSEESKKKIKHFIMILGRKSIMFWYR